jgi:NAD(P)-dependent dehydrogenase (short-subunit alcohol dehydrogenase family)
MGVDIAKAALAAGHAVVAIGRNPEKVSFVLGAHDDPIVLALDVTNHRADPERTLRAGRHHLLDRRGCGRRVPVRRREVRGGELDGVSRAVASPIPLLVPVISTGA